MALKEAKRNYTKATRNPIKSISILIPTYNSPHLERTVQSILKSREETPEISINLLIVCSNCTPDNIVSSKELVHRIRQSPKIEANILIEAKGGKSRAINKGVQSHFLSMQDLVFIICDDVLISKSVFRYLKHTVPQMNKLFGDYILTLFNIPRYKAKSEFLNQIMKLHHKLFYKYENQFLTGRAFLFFPNMIGTLPENIISEDMFIENKAKILKKELLVTPKYIFVSYQKPSTFSDYLRMIKRFDFSFRQYQKLYSQKTPKKALAKFVEIISGGKSKSFKKGITSFMQEREYSLITKVLLFGIIIYQSFVLPILFRISPPQKGDFKREKSSLEVASE